MKTDLDIDPRIKRTRQMLFQALRILLIEKNFEDISVQDIAERSTVNRGTVYGHYKDKYALLAALVEEDFGAIFAARTAEASGTCRWGVKQLILAVCDYLGPLLSCCAEHQRPFEPVLESTVRGMVYQFLLNALRGSDQVKNCAEATLRATAASWAICGTVMEWSRQRVIPADELAELVLPLVATVLFLKGPEK